MEALPKNVHRKDDSEKRYCQLLKKQTLELCHEEKHGKNFRETYFPERSDDTIMNWSEPEELAFQSGLPIKRV